MDIDGTPDCRKAILQLGRDGVQIGILGEAEDLDVDRRGQAEVQDLVHHVSGLKIELQGRKLAWKHPAQLADVSLSSLRTLGLQGDQQLAVGRTAGHVVAGGEVGSGRDADVVHDHVEILAHDPPDRIGHAGEIHAGVLDACAGRRGDMQSYRARINHRKEIASGERDQHGGACHRDREDHDHQHRTSQAQSEKCHVPAAEGFEAPIESQVEPAAEPGRLAFVRMPVPGMPKQVMRHDRHQRARKGERDADGEHHRQRHRDEQVFRRARQQRHRQKDDADGQRGDKRRHGDFVRSVEDSLDQALAHIHVAMDVFDCHRRVVHENAHGQRETAERHEVQGVPESGQAHDAGQDRYRYRHDHDDRAAPAAEKQQDEQAGEARRDQAFGDHSLHRGNDECRLVEQHGEFQVTGKRHAVEHRACIFDDIQGRCLTGLENRHQHGFMAVVTHEIGLRHVAVAHVGNVAKIDDPAVDALERDLIQERDLRGTGVEPQHIFRRTDEDGAGRPHQILLVERPIDLARRQALRRQPPRVQVGHDDPRIATIRRWQKRTLYRGERLPHRELGEVEHLGLGLGLAAERDLHDRHARGIVGEDDGGRGADRHPLQHRLRRRRHLRHGLVDANGRLEVDTDDALAEDALRLDALDVAHELREREFAELGDLVGHVRRGKAVELPDHGDDGFVDRREDVLRRTQYRERTREDDDQTNDDERVGSAQCELDDPHGWVTSESIVLMSIAGTARNHRDLSIEGQGDEPNNICPAERLK